MTYKKFYSFLLFLFLLITATSCSRSSEEKEAESLFEKTENAAGSFIEKQVDTNPKNYQRFHKYMITHAFYCSSPIGTCLLKYPQYIGSTCAYFDTYGTPFQGTVTNP